MYHEIVHVIQDLEPKNDIHNDLKYLSCTLVPCDINITKTIYSFKHLTGWKMTLTHHFLYNDRHKNHNQSELGTFLQGMYLLPV
jgi:hypothetical protein